MIDRISPASFSCFELRLCSDTYTPCPRSCISFCMVEVCWLILRAFVPLWLILSSEVGVNSAGENFLNR